MLRRCFRKGVSKALPSSVSPMEVGLLVPSSVGLAFSLGPDISFPTSSDFCGTPSLSDNQLSSGTQSSEGSRIRYSLHNRTVLSGNLDSCGVEDPLGKGLGSLPRALSSSWGWGRRSHILLAQDRAKIDVASSRKIP
jgi:hypothetical protein